VFLKGEDVSTWEFDELCWDAVFVEAREDGGGLGGFSGTVEAFDDDERAAFCVGHHDFGLGAIRQTYGWHAARLTPDSASAKLGPRTSVDLELQALKSYISWK